MATAGNNYSTIHKEELPDGGSFSFALVVAEWNGDITSKLTEGAKNTLLTAGVAEKNISTYMVPGTFELPYAAAQICKNNKVDGVITIGCVIRGETAHFDYVCQGTTYGIQKLNTEQDIPVIFCVLTDDNKQQSIDRSGGKHGNKGDECAAAVLKMAAFRKGL